MYHFGSESCQFPEMMSVCFYEGHPKRDRWLGVGQGRFRISSSTRSLAKYEKVLQKNRWDRNYCGDCVEESCCIAAFLCSVWCSPVVFKMSCCAVKYLWKNLRLGESKKLEPILYYMGWLYVLGWALSLKSNTVNVHNKMWRRNLPKHTQHAEELQEVKYIQHTKTRVQLCWWYFFFRL